ncbi:MAG TPA: DUF2784 domain-containing protein [Thermoanaerobaculia bacterium]
MPYRILAGAVVALHLGFVLFVAAGGLLVWRWRRWAWAHLPAVAWGVWIELSGGICPLTPLENELRRLGGEAAYSGDFVGHYLLPVLYPEGLDRGTQAALAAGVLALNAAVYWRVLRRPRRSPPPASPPALR